MGYRAQQGMAMSVLHPVYNLDGSGALVPGQAAAVTKNLKNPDRAAATEVPVLSDIGVTGWVKSTQTLLTLGTYTLFLKSPGAPIADGREERYDIDVGPGVPTSPTALTSLDRVRQRLQLKNATDVLYGAAEASPFDALLNLLISEVSDEYQRKWRRILAQQAYTDYLDGTGTNSLILNQGPLVSLTSLDTVEYRDNGAGGVTEVLTAVPRHSYVLSGSVADPTYHGQGRIDLVGAQVFNRGRKNYRAAYLAGFASIPEMVAGIVTTRVVNDFMSHDTKHLASNIRGEGNIQLLNPWQLEEAERKAMEPFFYAPTL